MRTFGELIAEIGRLIGRPDSVYRDHIKAALNLAIEEYTAEFATPFNHRRTTFLATGAQQQALPQDCDRPVWFLDVSNLRGIDPGLEWDRYYPGTFGGATVGSTWEWQLDGLYPTIEHPSGSLLTIESAASDGRAVLVAGVVFDSASSGWGSHEYAARERAYLTGTTAVTLTTAFQRIDEIAVASRLESAVVVRRGTKAVAIVEPGEVSPQYLWVRWLRVPQAGTQVMMEYIPRTPRLRDDDQAIPAYVPARYLVWAPIAQLATDLNKDDLARLALMRKREIVQGERQKQIAFGDLDNRATPLIDDWDWRTGVD